MSFFFSKDSQGSPNENPAMSKWETMEQTEEKLGKETMLIRY
jgi:hypothetical protein